VSAAMSLAHEAGFGTPSKRPRCPLASLSAQGSEGRFNTSHRVTHGSNLVPRHGSIPRAGATPYGPHTPSRVRRSTANMPVDCQHYHIIQTCMDVRICRRSLAAWQARPGARGCIHTEKILGDATSSRRKVLGIFQKVPESPDTFYLRSYPTNATTNVPSQRTFMFYGVSAE
jgi:hypothetical protein